jgi:hypothetical protein
MKSYRVLPGVLIMFFCVFVSSCKSGEALEGRYEARNAASDSAIVLELKSDGKGSWSQNHENIDFGWEIRGSQILLHTKSGGVITGIITHDHIIEINLPGVGSFRLEKVST